MRETQGWPQPKYPSEYETYEVKRIQIDIQFFTSFTLSKNLRKGSNGAENIVVLHSQGT